MHEPKSLSGLLISLLCTFWAIPFYSIIFYFAGEENSCFRKWKYLNWESYEPDEEHSPMRQYLMTKFFKNFGFVLEAIFEALPMSILQLTYIVMTDHPNVIALISILISMLSVCSKCFLIISSIVESKSWLNTMWMWLSFVVDFIGIFFLVYLAFYDSPSEFETFFDIVSGVIRWAFVLGVVPCALGAALCMAYESVNEIPGIILKCCAYPILFVICFVGCTLTVAIANTSWLVVFLLVHGSVGRMPDGKKTNFKFYETLFHWILNEATDVVDSTDQSIILPKCKDRILRVCIINNILVQKNSEYLVNLRDFLKEEARTDIREHASNHAASTAGKSKIRNAQFWKALMIDFCGSPFIVTQRQVRRQCNEDLFYWMIIASLTWVFGPICALSRVIFIILPFAVLIRLSLADGFETFREIGEFQMIISMMYVFVLMIWFVGAVVVMRDEYYLWNILPTRMQLDLGENDVEGEISAKRTLSEIHSEYYNISMRPVIKKILILRFGDDLAEIIEIYLF